MNPDNTYVAPETKAGGLEEGRFSQNAVSPQETGTLTLSEGESMSRQSVDVLMPKSEAASGGMILGVAFLVAVSAILVKRLVIDARKS